MTDPSTSSPSPSLSQAQTCPTLGPAQPPDKSTRTACAFCRKRKLKCDRQLPSCFSCQKFGFSCEYPMGMAKLNSRSDRGSSKVRQLENRLGRVEHLLHTKQRHESHDSSSHSGSTSASTSMSSSSKATDAAATAPDVSLDLEIINSLEKIFFEFVHPLINIIHPIRYARQLQESGLEPPIYLRQAICALASSISEEYSYCHKSFYQSSRKCLEENELRDQQLAKMSLSQPQTWILISLYELMHGHFHRGWMSTSRAVRLIQMLRLHRIDGPTHVVDPGLNLIDLPQDFTEAEERRRVFWLAFILDRFACIAMGFPSLIDERDIRTYLPVSNEAFEQSAEEPHYFLSDALAVQESTDLSPFAVEVIMAALCGSKLGDLQRFDPNSLGEKQAGSIWFKPQRLNSSLTTEFCVPRHLSVPFVQLDPFIVFLNMSTASGTLSVHRFAHSQANQDSVSEEMISRSEKQCLDAALKIVKIMKLTAHWDLRTFHPFTPYCLFSAGLVLASSWLSTRDDSIENSLRFLLDSLESFKKITELASILLQDIHNDHPSLRHELDPPSTSLTNDDLLTFSDFRSPEGSEVMQALPVSRASFEASAGLGDFDLFYDGATGWDVDLDASGTSSYPPF